MEKQKGILFYLVGLVGLAAISIFFTGRIEIDVRDLPTATPTITPTVLAQTECQTTPGGVAFGRLPDAPFTTTLAPPDLPGERLVISGTVYASDCVTPLPNALIEVWQADANGQYDRSPPFTLRAQMRTDNSGRYEFYTIRPGSYDTFNGTRPAHIHYWVSYADNDPLATRLLFADDPYLADSNLDPALLTTLTEEAGPAGPRLRGTFDIVLSVPPPTPSPTPSPEEQLSIDSGDRVVFKPHRN